MQLILRGVMVHWKDSINLFILGFSRLEHGLLKQRLIQVFHMEIPGREQSQLWDQFRMRHGCKTHRFEIVDFDQLTNIVTGNLFSAHLVPVFSFGENEVFDQVENPRGTCLRWIQERLQSLMGISLPLFHARGIFQYSFGLMPYRKPIHTVGK